MLIASGLGDVFGTPAAAAACRVEVGIGRCNSMSRGAPVLGQHRREVGHR